MNIRTLKKNPREDRRREVCISLILSDSVLKLAVRHNLIQYERCVCERERCVGRKDC